MDLFGKKAQQELEQLQKRMNDLELHYSDMVAKHSRVSEELQESLALVATINAANKSIALHYDEKRNHDQKATEYSWKIKEIASKEAELLDVHEKKKAALTKEMRELEEKLSALKTELADSQKRSKALDKEIQAGESKRDSIAADIEKLKTGRSDAETALSKSQEKQSELAGAVDRLTRQQEALSKSNLYLNQVVSRLNRYGDDNTVFASLEHDLHRFLAHDRTSGAVQVELKARPLLLVVDLGYDSLNFAAVRAGLVSGGNEISLCLVSRKIEKKLGCRRFETLLAGWVWNRFTAIYPRLKKSVKDQNGVEHSLPVAQRLLALLCQGAPQGEVEETIVIDSEPFNVSIPLMREELVSVFLPLLGPDGELTEAIRSFLAECKLSVDAIDRIVCMGIYSRLPLLSESLADVFNQSILLSEIVPTVASTEAVPESEKVERQQQATPYVNVTMVSSDPGREQRELVVKKCHKKAGRELLECDARKQEGFRFMGDLAIDIHTGLMWATNANIAGKEMKWRDAMKWVQSLKLGGYSDWRMPSKKELMEFAMLGGDNPYGWFKANGFNDVQYAYWSSSTFSCNDTEAWYVSMTVGFTNNMSKGESTYVWPVRCESECII